MKRRASVQLVPEKDFFPKYEDPYSTEPEDYTPSKRIIYKPKPIILKEVPQQSSSYLSLLESLKSTNSHEKTEEFLKEINSVDIITPRRILPIQQPSYKLTCQVEGKFKVNKANKGKGTIEITQSSLDSKKISLVIFRNCIKKILFTGALYTNSEIILQVLPCKEKKHENKADISLSLLQQPEGQKVSCLICISTASLQELLNSLEENFKYIKG